MSLSRRKLNLILISLIPILFCLSSITLLIIYQQQQQDQSASILNHSKNLIHQSLAQLVNHQQIKSSAQKISSHLIDWLDSQHLSTSFPSIHLAFSSSQLKQLEQQQQLQQLPLSPHPILPILINSRQSWKSILQSQPLTLDQARQDYQKRFYPLLPPPGFDQWYQFAIQRNFTLINRFDGLMSDLDRFRNISAQELIRRTRELVQIPGITSVKITSNSLVQIHALSGRLATGHTLKQMIDQILSDSDFKFPELELAINEHSEARVLPRQTRSLSSLIYLSDSLRELYERQDPEKKPSLAGFKPEWGHDGSVWDAYRRACPPNSAARRLVETVRSSESQTGAVAAGGGLSSMSSTQTHLSLNRPTRLRSLHPNGTAPLPSPRELMFLNELESTASFCDRPSTHHLHSAFFADQRSIEHLYPLFSPSKPQGFADIMIPSYYHYSPRAEYVYEVDLKNARNLTPTDPPWNQKANKMYWRGKLTRGADSPPGHMSSFQKQRLVKLVSNDTDSTASLAAMAHKQGEADPSWRSETNRVLVSLNVTSENLISVSAPATVVDPLLLDVALACDPKAGECRELNHQGYHTQPPAPLSEYWKSKIALDLDDAGFSPWFGALMESRSAVVKMSVHQEFWRDWVQPWYHFIPLSSSYAELHNLLTFFLGIPDVLKDQTLPIKKDRARKKFEKRSDDSSFPTENPDKNEGQENAGQMNEEKGESKADDEIVTSDRKDENPPTSSEDQQADKTGLEAFNADDELRKIGANGQDWKLRHMRQEDMEVYLFRLLIEWARILHPEASSASPKR